MKLDIVSILTINCGASHSLKFQYRYSQVLQFDLITVAHSLMPRRKRRSVPDLRPSGVSS